MTKNFVIVERQGAVAVLRFNRPEKLNALSPEMLAAIAGNVETLDADDEVRVIILYGGERAFAAGADIGAMAQLSPVEVAQAGTREYWLRIWAVDTPLIAAVSGYAYGGGCELAMSCDLIVAAETARFAQPEIKLGIMPGAGGTQRLARAIGPYRAMEMVLTGEPVGARELHAAGLINRLVPVERILDEALELAQTIASRPAVAVSQARKAVRYGVERTVSEGLELERTNYELLYGTEDQAEGMEAFLEKRDPDFKHR
ncbi:MAG: enoyl-CoA hydratase [Chloroflexi bacterium]|nr:enoyl-CoA hydratase [Chloroflexota bacterium]